MDVPGGTAMLNRVANNNTLVLLLGGFSLLIGLMVAITYHSLSQLGQSKARLDAIVTVHNEKAALIGAMQHANRERVISLQHMFVAEDFFEVDAAAMHNIDMASVFLVARSALDAMPRAPGEADLLAMLETVSVEGLPFNDRVRELLWTHEDAAREEARHILAEGALASQNRIYGIFDDLNRLYEAETAAAVEGSAREYDAARLLIVALLKLTVLLSVVAGLFVTVLIIRNQRSLESRSETLETLVQKRTAALQRISSEAVAARREAEDANSAKSTFLANMSHELRTPLNAVLGFSEIMDQEVMGPMPKPYREYPGHINSSARHLLQMIQQLLDMSRIEAGHLDLDEKPVCLDSLLNETAMIVRSAFDRDEQTLRLDPAGSGIALHADQRMLKQTLINILGNAAKYSDVEAPIDIAVALDAGRAVVTVRDRGIGIAPDEIARLFNPYERSEAQTARERQGTGLGLSISRSLIEAHGGTLTLDSVLCEGTTVTIALPAARVLAGHDAAPVGHAA